MDEFNRLSQFSKNEMWSFNEWMCLIKHQHDIVYEVIAQANAKVKQKMFECAKVSLQVIYNIYMY